MTAAAPAAWLRVALVMFAVGWGANQFSPMLIVYRHSLGLRPGEIAGLFAIYAATLIPGLLAGGPLSDRFGRRACVLPFAALSPVATLLLVLGPRSLPLIVAGRALAGLCSGMVFGPATAWVQDLSHGDALSARRAALALSAGFGLGPVVAALLAQWAGSAGANAPLVVPYLPHLALGTAALAIGLTVPGTEPGTLRSEPTTWQEAPGQRPPAARRAAIPCVLARRRARRPVRLRLRLPRDRGASRGGHQCAHAVGRVRRGDDRAHVRRGHRGAARRPPPGRTPAAGRPRRRARLRRGRRGRQCRRGQCHRAGIAAPGPGQFLAGFAAVLLGLGYGLCLVSGLHQAEQLAGPADRGTVLGVYYVLAYLGFAAPYAVDGLNLALGQPGTFAAAAGAAAVLAGLTWVRAARERGAAKPFTSSAPPVAVRND